ncbi:MAG: class I SAM-dependent methyltransferase [Planctomycetia bacterium]|nr:class I SAM-dependent methyltransferase [Planctomycetia bacterium]
MHLIYRQTCRVCGSAALTKVIDLGEQYLQGSFIGADGKMPPLRKIDTALVRCDPMRDERACGLLQMTVSVPPAILYTDYWYRSGTNRTMTEHLGGIVSELVEMVGKPTARVLDIGCNDGTMLRHYPATYVRYGIDPSDAAKSASSDVQVVNDLFPSEQLTSLTRGKAFEVITSIAMFYDLEDPTAFARSVKQHLAQDGVWCFEMSYMPAMLRCNSYDTICHEHLEYYSLAVLEYILRQASMKVVRVSLNDCNGASIRVHATHSDNFIFDGDARAQAAIRELRQQEFDLQLDTDEPYRNFQDAIERHKTELSSLLRRLKNAGKKVHIYGASTKGNTILQTCGINNTLVECAAERNPKKFGGRTLGTNIPIVSEEESRSRQPDYYLVLPWHFKEEFLDRERAMLDAGVGFIFPLPQIEIVTRPQAAKRAA